MVTEPLYTDMGQTLELRGSDGRSMSLPRYAVWKWDPYRQRHQVAEVGEDLATLRAQHGDGPLVDLPKPRN